jgi:hypothetical protein
MATRSAVSEPTAQLPVGQSLDQPAAQDAVTVYVQSGSRFAQVPSRRVGLVADEVVYDKEASRWITQSPTAVSARGAAESDRFPTFSSTDSYVTVVAATYGGSAHAW